MALDPSVLDPDTNAPTDQPTLDPTQFSGAPVEQGLPPRGTILARAPSPDFQKATGFKPADWDNFRQFLAPQESNSYDAPRTATGSSTTPYVMGRYQQGDEEIANAAQKLGIRHPTDKQFLSDPNLQEDLFEQYTRGHHDTLMQYPPYAQGDTQTRLALLAGAHLGGPGAIMSGSNPADNLGTHVSDYVHRAHAYISGHPAPDQGAPPLEMPKHDPAAAQSLQAEIQASGITATRQAAPAPVSTSTSPPEGTPEYYKAQLAAQQQTLQNPYMAYGMPPEGPSVLGQIGAIAKEAPAAVARGLARLAGMPVDAVNAAIRFSFQHPEMGASAVASEMDPLSGDAMMNTLRSAPGGFDPKVLGTNLVAGGVIPGAQKNLGSMTAPQIPAGGAETMLSGLGKVGVQNRSPEERGANSPGLQFTSDVGEMIGMGGGGFIGFGRGLAASGLAAAAKAGALDALTTGIFPGLGSALGKELGGEGGSEIGQLAGTAIGLKAAALRSGINYFMLEPAERGAPGLASGLINSLGPGKVAAAASDDLASALARVEQLKQAPGAVSTPQGLTGEQGLVSGFVTPSFALSGDDGLRTLGAHIIRQDPEGFRTARAVVDGNVAAIQHEIGLTGRESAEVGDALSTYSGERSLATQRMLADAQTRAEQAVETATGGASNSLVEKANRSAATMHELEVVDQDRRTLANADFDLARTTGVMQTNAGEPTNTYSQATNLLSEYRRLHLDSSIPQPALDLLFKDKVNPEAMFDRSGMRVPGAATPAREFGTETTLEQQQSLMSQLGNMLTNEGALIRTGSGAGDPQKVRFLARLQDSVRQDFENSLNSSGNPALVRNALNNWDEYNNTFRKGILGRALGYDASGAPRVAPEAALDTILKSGTQGVANSRQLLSAMEGRLDPATGLPAHPVEGLRDRMVEFLQQDFANASAHGQAAMDKWAANHEALLTGPHALPGSPFAQLSHDVNQAIVEGRNFASAKPRAEAADDAVSLYLKGDPGGELNKALHGPNRGESMLELIRATEQDPHGTATEGLGKMMLDRMLGAGARPSVNGGWDLNPRATAAYYRENLEAYKAFDPYVPGFSDRAAKIANSMERLGQIVANPGSPLTVTQAINMASLGGIGRIAARMVGATVGEAMGRHLLGGHIGGQLQYAAIGAEQGIAMWDATIGKLTRSQAGATLREAMFNPDLFEKLAKPWRNTSDVLQATSAMQRLMLAMPKGYQLATGVSLVTPPPQTGPNTGPNPQALGGLPAQTLGQTQGGLPPASAPPVLLPGGRALGAAPTQGPQL